MVASWVAVRTDDELRELLVPEICEHLTVRVLFASGVCVCVCFTAFVFCLPCERETQYASVAAVPRELVGATAAAEHGGRAL